MIVLPVAPITAVGFAPYGWLAAGEGRDGRLINDGTSLRIDDVGELALTAEGGVPSLSVFRASARDLRGPWRWLERHRLGTQTFIPLGGVHHVALVATGDPQPDLATLAAFLVSGNQATTLRAGTWHHGLIALERGDFVVVDRHAGVLDCEIAELAEAVTLIGAG